MSTDDTDRGIQHTVGKFPTSYEMYEAGNWPYAVTPLDPKRYPDAIVKRGLHEWKFKAENGEWYAGAYSRAMMENLGADPEQDLLYLGIDDHGRPVPVKRKELSRHLFGGGRSGAGKTTEAMCLLRTLAEDEDIGFVFIDPGGKDYMRLFRMLPDHRIEAGDVIIMEPGELWRDRHIAFNFLDTFLDPDHPLFHRELESLTSILMPLLDAKYPRMKGVAKHMLRALIEAGNHPQSPPAAIQDMLRLLQDEAGREDHGSLIENRGLERLRPFAGIIVETLDEGDLEPLLRRLKEWYENPLMKPLVAERYSSVNLSDIFAEGKILLVNANTGNDDATQMTMSSVSQKFWSLAKGRPTDEQRFQMEREGVDIPDLGFDEDGNQVPYYFAVDEFHAVADDSSQDVGEILGMARKRDFGMYIMTQQLHQVEGLKDDIMGNVSTFMAGHPGRSNDERKELAEAFDGLKPADMSLDDYKVKVTIKDFSGEEHVVEMELHAPYPPRRTKEQAAEYMDWMLDEYGKPRDDGLDADEEFEKFMDVDVSGLDDVAGEVSAASSVLTEAREHWLTKAVYDESIARGERGGWVPADALEERVETYLEVYCPDPLEITTGRKVDDLLDVTGAIDIESRSDGTVYRPDKQYVKEHIEGTTGKENDGKRPHRELLKDTYRLFVARGYVVDIVEQDGGALPDALLRLDEYTPDMSSLEPAEADRVLQDYRENNRLEHRLAGFDDEVYIEAESSTSDQGSQTVLNLLKATREGKRCLFVARPKDVPKVWRTLTAPPFTSETRVPEDAERKFFNNGNLQIDGEVMQRSGSRINVWVDTGEAYELRDDAGNVHARTTDATAIFTDRELYDTDELRGAESRNVKVPVLPERVFRGFMDAEGRLPEPGAEGEFDVLSVPYSDEERALEAYDGAFFPLEELVDRGESVATDEDDEPSVFEELRR